MTDVAESKLRHKVCVNAEDITRLRKERLAKIRSISLSLCQPCPKLPQSYFKIMKITQNYHCNCPLTVLEGRNSRKSNSLKGHWCYFGLIRAQMRAHCLICDQVGAYPCRALPCPKLVEMTLALWTKLAVKKDVFVLWVWLTGFGGLNGARRAIGLEDSNKDHRTGPKNLPKKNCGSQNRAICPNCSSQCRAS